MDDLRVVLYWLMDTLGIWFWLIILSSLIALVINIYSLYLSLELLDKVDDVNDNKRIMQGETVNKEENDFTLRDVGIFSVVLLIFMIIVFGV
tara:strand:+ start:835 stop:1110 length:276 start_codon:yes stop_codon:yes gene_type:complete